MSPNSVDIESFQASEIDVVISSSGHGDVDPLKRPDAASPAEIMVRDMRVETIVLELMPAAEQPQIVGRRLGRPQPRLGADRAVAFRRAGADVEIGFEADRVAMATAATGFLHQKSSR